MWSWPLPGFVPWVLEVNSEGFFSAPVGHPVHAVEDGIVVQVFASLVIQGQSGNITYWAVESQVPLGTVISRGDQIGVVGKAVPTSGIAILVLKDGNSVPTDKLLWQAWAQVTDRFHRDAIPPPTTPAARKALVTWIMSHPLFEHPYSMLLPPDYGTNPACFEGPPCEGMPGCTHAREPDETWVEQDIGDGSIYDCLCLEYHYVDPTTESIQDDDTRNTAFRVWIEAGGWEDCRKTGEPEPDEGWNNYNRWRPTFSVGLECGGPTMEDALIQLALRVQFYYGIGAKSLDRPWHCDGSLVGEGMSEEWESGCVDAGDGFCKVCGYLMPIDEEEEVDE